MQETWVQSLGWEDPLKKEMAAHSSMLAWKSHAERSLAGYSPWGLKELDTTKGFPSSSDLAAAAAVAHMVKNLPAMQETQVRSLSQEDPLKKGMATHSSILS